MSPTKPKHGNVEYRVSKLIGDFVETHDLGDVFVGEVGVYTQRNPDTVRGADVVFISHAQYERSAAGDFFTVAPELVVEILPPDDRWSHVRQKLREYFGIGVRIVLVVDVKEAVIELYRSPTNVQELRAGDVLTMEDVLPGLSLPVEKLLGE
ncbi:MAG: Uma2 family endonuclease [Ardenticatenales bacterium]|nr:Uma2 family endonuclease [Ardenticatenales bacterium]